MRNILLLFALMISFSFTNSTEMTTGVLVVEFEDLQAATGEIEITIFDKKTRFLRKNKSMEKKRIRVEGDKVYAEFYDLPYGTYAIASYHDINANKKFDRTFMGLPKEPYAFSQKFSSKLRKPKFKEVAIQVNAPKNIVKMQFMRY